MQRQYRRRDLLFTALSSGDVISAEINMEYQEGSVIIDGVAYPSYP
jgi:hypothetical protein